MITSEYKIRVPYVDVDQMGFLYHAHYIEYFDMARTEMIREAGMSNKQLEEEGCMLPVMNVTIDYKFPANYDDLITIKTTLKKIPSATMTFFYEVSRGDVILNTASVTVAFMNPITKKACRPPKKLMDLIRPHFK
ncbi:MAG: acyl-CoA thioesterase [Bacteroidetes bacterium]|nr:acyl-CoA thioesterase [Bacteroidota bacterium]